LSFLVNLVAYFLLLVFSQPEKTHPLYLPAQCRHTVTYVMLP